MNIESLHIIKFNAYYKTVPSIKKFIENVQHLCNVYNSTFEHEADSYPGIWKFTIYAIHESDALCISDALHKLRTKSIGIAQ